MRTRGGITAPGSVQGRREGSLARAANVRSSILVMVAERGLPEFNNENQDHVAIATSVYDTLRMEGKDVEMELLGPFDDKGQDLFQELRPEHWDPVEAYLSKKLSDGTH